MSEFDFNKNPETFSGILEKGLVNPFEEHQRNIEAFIDKKMDRAETSPEETSQDESFFARLMRWFGFGLASN